MKKLSVLATVLMSLTLACGSVGKRFDSSHLKNIHQGITKKSEILDMFGSPFKEGEQNGKTTWTYQYNQYSVYNDGSYKDLVILFDENHTVESYRYTSSLPHQ